MIQQDAIILNRELESCIVTDGDFPDSTTINESVNKPSPPVKSMKLYQNQQIMTHRTLGKL